MAYAEAAVGKPFAADSAEVYFDLLGDLPVETLRVAVKRVVLEHKWATFPSVAEFRRAAAECARGDIPSAGEAWMMATRACLSCDVDSPGSVERTFAKVPPIVHEAVNRFGFRALYNPGENLEVMRAQFTRIYEEIVAFENRQALLPASLRREIAKISDPQPQLPREAQKLLAGIWKEPDGAERVLRGDK